MEKHIFRVNKRDRWVTMLKDIFEDPRLSWETRGLLGYLLSKPDGWRVQFWQLVKAGNAKKDRMQRMLNELKQAGYIHRTKIRGPGGRWQWITTVYEHPSLNPHAPQPVNPALEEPQPDLPATDEPATDEPATDEPAPENPAVTGNDEQGEYEPGERRTETDGPIRNEAAAAGRTPSDATSRYRESLHAQLSSRGDHGLTFATRRAAEELLATWGYGAWQGPELNEMDDTDLERMTEWLWKFHCRPTMADNINNPPGFVWAMVQRGTRPGLSPAERKNLLNFITRKESQT